MPSGPGKSLLWNFGQSVCRIWTTRYFDLKVYGKRHIPPTGGVLIVSNHQSYLDPILLAVQLRRPMSFLARATLFRNRFFSWLITNLNAFPVKRGEGDVGAVKEMIRRLEEGHMLAMFPEGTRTETGEMKSLEPGVALVLRRAKAAVVPAVIEGSFHAWPKGKNLPRAYPVRVLYGPVIDISGMRANQIIPLLETRLREMVADLRSGHFEKYG
ncbi:MAG TPA: lysophospholipid acyltransferase family protein [Tepidisphaeraceae bacterium]|jgi:1-acyl-sn-glycerol-3-phosphate acyltransferase